MDAMEVYDRGSMPNHFSPETMKFLRGLARHNEREWFNARKHVYESELKTPMLALVEEITQAMVSFAPEHMRPANKIMMRIYRDTRFSNDKRPYKRHLSAWWARRGMEKTSGGGFYLQISPQEVMLAAGVYMPEREQLLALRRWMAEHHTEYRALVKAVLKNKAGGFQQIDAEALTRMPKGFGSDHPAGELLRAKNWGVRCALPAEAALRPQLARELVRRMRLAAPVVDALNGAILSARPAEIKQPRLWL
jgi:uncharacterized protein (TIGR02453 family)